MKQLILTIVFMASAFALCAQNYEARYASFGIMEGYGVLTFNVSEWRYDKFNKAKIIIASDDIRIGGGEEKVDTEKEVSSYDYYSMGDNAYLWQLPLLSPGGGYCVIKGELFKPDWEIISDSTRVIGGYVCTMAEGDLCGRKFKVWFTPEIAVSCGPWRLWGLPGLIMNAYSEDGTFDFQLTSLKEIPDAPERPEVEKTMTKQEYVSLLEAAMKKIERAVSMMGDRNTVISATTNIDRSDKCIYE